MSSARIRVLQVVSSLAAGGVETWLTHVHRHVDRTRFHIDYVVHTSGRSHYTDIVTALGGAIYHCPSPRNPLRYLPSLIATLKRHGPFDVVHSHVQHFSGVVLLAARAAGVPVRIAHCHTAGLPRSRYLSLPRHLYTSLAGHWIRRHATHKLSGSHASAPALFGRGPASDGSYQVLYNGIDLEPFRCREDGASVRAEWGISATAMVAGHVGSFTPVKNHELLLRTFASLQRQVPNARLLLVGDGPLFRSMRALARTLGCDEQVVFTGVRRDVPRLMRAMDVFLFPSLSEGLGLVALEAQAAGVPVIASEGVPSRGQRDPRADDMGACRDVRRMGHRHPENVEPSTASESPGSGRAHGSQPIQHYAKRARAGGHLLFRLCRRTAIAEGRCGRRTLTPRSCRRRAIRGVWCSRP